MSNYAELIYPPDEGNTYPDKLAEYISNRFIKTYNPKSKRGGVGYNPSTRTNDGSGNFVGKAKILDIGCCRGDALRRLKNNQAKLELYGVDVRDEQPDGVVFETCNLEKDSLPFDDNTFDFVYSKSVLEHVFNTDNFVSESLRVLKPGGVFIGLTPDWRSQQDFFWDDYTHVKPFTRKGLRDCLRMHGFDNADCEIFYQLPFTWDNPALTFIPKLVSLLPDCLKWKDSEQRNTKDRKLIRFSKEKMLLSYGQKPKK